MPHPNPVGQTPPLRRSQSSVRPFSRRWLSTPSRTRERRKRSVQALRPEASRRGEGRGRVGAENRRPTGVDRLRWCIYAVPALCPSTPDVGAGGTDGHGQSDHGHRLGHGRCVAGSPCYAGWWPGRVPVALSMASRRACIRSTRSGCSAARLRICPMSSDRS